MFYGEKLMDEEQKEETKTQPEENKTETKIEEPIIGEGEVSESQIETESAPIPVDTPADEPCDPTTMTCDEMRDRFLELSDKRSPYIESIRKLDEIKKVIPSDEINKAYDDAVAEKQKIDDEIYGIFEKFTVCTTKPKPAEQVGEAIDEAIEQSQEKTEESF